MPKYLIERKFPLRVIFQRGFANNLANIVRRIAKDGTADSMAASYVPATSVLCLHRAQRRNDSRARAAGWLSANRISK